MIIINKKCEIISIKLFHYCLMRKLYVKNKIILYFYYFNIIIIINFYNNYCYCYYLLFFILMK